MAKFIRGYTPLNRPGDRDERSPAPKVRDRQRKLEEIFLAERDPLRKFERYDALMAHQDPNAIANLPEKSEYKYFKDVKTVLVSPFLNLSVVKDHNGEEW
jgi:hypothetical protein